MRVEKTVAKMVVRMAESKAVELVVKRAGAMVVGMAESKAVESADLTDRSGQTWVV